MKLHDPVDGLLLVDKASGITSHDVVALVRRRLGAQKVGHCGTLDPLATGLLLIVVGKATKIQDLLMSEDKEYVGTMKLGEITDSQDCDGQVIEQRSVEAIDPGRVKAAFQKFHGDFYQTPPMVSAIKRDGVPLYKLARQGKVVDRAARFVHVYAHEIRAIRLPEIDFRVICSKGFYGAERVDARHPHSKNNSATRCFANARSLTSLVRLLDPRRHHEGSALDRRASRNRGTNPLGDWSV